MSFRDDITIDWSVSPRIIEVAAPSTTLTIQDLYDTLRSLGAGVDAIDKDEIIDGSGKEDLGGGTLVGLTVKLLNAQVKFEDRPGPDYIQCTVKDGNLVGGVSGNPIKESAYTQVKLILSAAGTIAETGVSGLTAEESEKLMQAASQSELEAVHGAGSWEGATPTQVWNHDDRKLTSRDIESALPGEHLPSEEQVQDIQAVLDLVKGLGFDSAKDALVKIKQLVEASGRRGASFKV
jgi:hypothetical protein